MAWTLLRPNSTVSSTGVNVFPAGSTIHSTLADESDSSGIQKPLAIANGNVRVGFPTLSAPAGTKVIQLWLDMRVGTSGATGVFHDPRVHEGANTYALQPSWHEKSTGGVGLRTSTLDGPFAGGALSALEVFVGLTGYADGSGGIGAAYITRFGLWVQHVPPGEVTVVAPTGTTNSVTPQVAWTANLDGDGGEQTHWEVKVFDEATYTGGGFDPDTAAPTLQTGVRAGNHQFWTPTSQALTAAGSYRAYVRVAQLVYGEQLWSDWDHSSFVATPTNTVTITNEGNAPTPAIIRIDGPATDPVIVHESGAAISLDYDLPAGQYIEIDTVARTVLLNGSTNIYSAVVPFPTWFKLLPGDNALTVTGVNDARISWRDAWQ